MFAAWLRAGLEIETDSSGLLPFQFEISPRFAADCADFCTQWAARGPSLLWGRVLLLNNLN